MSEYQYYEFQAIDRPLTAADREALRAISTRARITATSFTNSYEWGNLKADPAKMMERWFDLHLYLTNWGSRRLMIRMPTRLLDRTRVDCFLQEIDCATLREASENVILDIVRDELEFEDWDEGSGWLAALTPLRAEVLAGDLRLFYLLWLTAVEEDAFDADEPEPMPGIGPMTAALEAFSGFFGLDPDLVQAAAERSAGTGPGAAPPGAVRTIISSLSNSKKTALLARLFDGDPHVAAELRAEVRDRMAATEVGAPRSARRTVGELRARAQEIGRERERAAAEKAAAERERQAKAAEKARRVRLDALARRGENVWAEVETEIERRNGPGYDRAASLLSDLRALADERGTTADYMRRLQAIRSRHEQKRTFIRRLQAVG